MISGLSSFLKRTNVPKKFNIDSLKRNINQTSMLIFLTIFILTAFSMWVINSAYTASKKQLAAQEISSSIESYKSHLSEKLSIIASSNVFIDFLHSGFATRERLTPAFLSLIYSLKSKPIIGMKIQDLSGRTIFEKGKATNNSLQLKICYLYQILNPALGDCNYTWSLFFDKNLILKSITSSNPSIKTCTNCQPTPFSTNEKFGGFNMLSTNNLSLQLTTLDKNTHLFHIYFILMTLLVSFLSLLSWFRLNHLFNNYIVNPINKLTTALKHDIPLNEENNIDEIQLLIDEISAWRKKHLITKDLEQKATLAKISAQLAHDIRSPVAAMRIVLDVLPNLADPHKRILYSSLENIDNITNNFLNQYKNCDNTGKNLLILNTALSPLLQSIVLEKSMQHKNSNAEINLEIPENFTNITASINPTEFKRLISNLINNAVEAMTQPGSIKLALDIFGQFVRLTLSDTGKGIPAHLLDKIVQGGVSIGKEKGHGLGLSHAKKMIELWQGNFEIQSVEGIGTTISIMIPIAA